MPGHCWPPSASPPSGGEQGRAACEIGLNYCPDSGPLHASLGVDLARRGDQRQALRHFTAAERSQPTNPTYAMNLAQTWAALGQEQQAETAFARAVTLGYSDPKAARQRMDLLLEQARHFPGEADACYVLEWDGQRRARPTEDEVCACLRALVQGAVEYLTLTAPAPQGGVDFLQAARSGQREAPVELQAGLRSAGTRSLRSRTMNPCQAQSALLDFLAHSAPDLSGFTPLVPAEGNPPPIRL